MDSRQYGLLMGRYLLDAEDLHYGYWEGDLPVTLGNFPAAQEAYTRKILRHIPGPEQAPQVLDVGCGTGRLMARLAERGHRVDGVVPCPTLARYSRERMQAWPQAQCTVHQCKLEELDAAALAGRYDCAVFSESFQYIEPRDSLPQLERLLKPGATVVICDFFKTPAHRDGGPGSGSFSGGHPWVQFRESLERSPFKVEYEEDITARVSPSVAMLDALLMRRIKPALEVTWEFASSRHPWLCRVAAWMFRKRWQKLHYKYLAGLRTQATFERYKTYRLLVLRYRPGG